MITAGAVRSAGSSDTEVASEYKSEAQQLQEKPSPTASWPLECATLQGLADAPQVASVFARPRLPKMRDSVLYHLTRAPLRVVAAKEQT